MGLLLILLSGSLFAETRIFVHGYSAGGSRANCEQKYYCSYWGSVQYKPAAGQPQGPDILDTMGRVYDGVYPPFKGSPAAEVNVGWHTGYGWDWWGWDNGGLTPTWHMLYWWCGKHTGNTCRVTCHSTGCPMVGYLLANYGDQVNVLSVTAAGSAEGGTELVDGTLGIPQLTSYFLSLLTADFSVSGGLGANVFQALLGVGHVRAAYDHNKPGSVPWIQHAGYNGDALTSGILNGQDDGVVAHHSACAYREYFQANECSNDYKWAECRTRIWTSPWSYYWQYYPCQQTVAQWAGHSRTTNASRTGYDHTHTWLQKDYGTTHYTW